MLFLLVVCLLTVLVGYAAYAHHRRKAQAPPSELKTGLRVLSDPESLVKDLEK